MSGELFPHCFYAIRLWEAQLKEFFLDCIDKAHQSTFENPIVKNNGYFQKTDRNTPQTIYRKILKSAIEKHIWSFLPISVAADLVTVEPGLFQ